MYLRSFFKIIGFKSKDSITSAYIVRAHIHYTRKKHILKIPVSKGTKKLAMIEKKEINNLHYHKMMYKIN